MAPFVPVKVTKEVVEIVRHRGTGQVMRDDKGQPVTAKRTETYTVHARRMTCPWNPGTHGQKVYGRVGEGSDTAHFFDRAEFPDEASKVAAGYKMYTERHGVFVANK